MSKRRKWIILLAGGVLALAVLWRLLGDREPSYQGRTLAKWFDETERPGVARIAAGDLDLPIRAIGTNALPVILGWISYKPSDLRYRLNREAERFAPRLGRFLTLSERRANDAVTVFWTLGAEARAAIPELTRIAWASDGFRASRCIDSLVHIGPEALPSLLPLATNAPRWRVRTLAIHALGEFREGGFADTPRARRWREQAVPVLVQCWEDQDPRISEAADRTLDGFDQDIIFGVLTNALHSPSAQVRAQALRYMPKVRVSAGEVEAALRPMLSDPEYGVRCTTTNALFLVKRKWLTIAPPQ